MFKLCMRFNQKEEVPSRFFQIKLHQLLKKKLLKENLSNHCTSLTGLLYGEIVFQSSCIIVVFRIQFVHFQKGFNNHYVNLT